MPASTRFGIAYFGVRDPDHFRADLAAIAAQGFDWVLLPFSQDDARWEQRTFADEVRVARSLGLTSVISPWGGDEFGGEGVETSLGLGDWLARARDTGADALHVDEPRRPTTSVAQVLDLWGSDATAWLTMQPDRGGELPPDVAGRVAVLGTDAYEGDVAARVAATTAFRAVTGRLDLAWVEAFRIRAGAEPAVEAATRAMAGLAPMVGVWAWKGSTGRGVLRSDDPAAVQAAVAAAIRGVRRERS